MSDDPQRFGPRKAGDILGLHYRTVQQLAKEGKLAGYRTEGGHWRFSQADLDAYVEARRAEVAS